MTMVVRIEDDCGNFVWMLPKKLSDPIEESIKYQGVGFKKAVEDEIALAIKRLLMLLIATGNSPADIANRNMTMIHDFISTISKVSEADIKARYRK